MRTSMLFFTLLWIVLLSFSLSCGDGEDDDDDSGDTPSDDDPDDDINDDLNDDVDDDLDDDVDDDADDDLDDDVDDDADDDLNDDVDDDVDDDDTSGDTWTDSTSGLIWQNGDACNMNWGEAKSHCENLIWSDVSDWRLPTLSELRSLIRGCGHTVTGGDCGVTDECLAYMSCWNPPCQGCGFLSGPGLGGRYCPAELSGTGWIYWSSSQVEENPSTAWRIHFNDSLISYNDIDYSYCARCVH